MKRRQRSSPDLEQRKLDRGSEPLQDDLSERRASAAREAYHLKTVIQKRAKHCNATIIERSIFHRANVAGDASYFKLVQLNRRIQGSADGGHRLILLIAGVAEEAEHLKKILLHSRDGTERSPLIA